MKQNKNFLCVYPLIIVSVLFGFFFFTTCATAASSCLAEDKLEIQVAAEAQLEEFTCFFEKWKGAEVIHFKVSVKNASSKEQRFRVNIFLDNGKAVGGLIPRKVKNGLIQPGKIGTFTYPVRGMAEKPESLTLLIKTIN